MKLTLYSAIGLIAAIAFTACSTVKVPVSTYVPPSATKYSHSVVMPYDYDLAWQKLIKAASQTFFDIENFEKDSGLMTLNFGSGNVEANVNCGAIDGVGYVGIRLAQPDTEISLSGKMNLLVERVGEHATRVTAKARYNLDMQKSGYRCENSSKKIENCKRKVPYSKNLNWTFDSNSVDTVVTKKLEDGTSKQRTCAPTGEIERLVIDTIENA